MKNLKRVASLLFAAVMIMTVMSVAAFAESEFSITFRVEGPDDNIYYGTLSVPTDGKLTAADALMYLDEKSDEVKLVGADSGYITSVNDISAGKFGGWDGWYFAVNNEAPSVGIDSFELANDDNLVLYYGGYPCQIPYADTSRLDSDGVIIFKSNDTEYDESWNPKTVVNPVVDAQVTVNGEKYTTDKNGEITIPSDKLTNELSVQINKKDSSDAPAVLRFAPDFTLTYNAVLTSDTDTTSDLHSDTDTDSEQNKDVSSNISSTVSSSSATTTTTATTTTSVKATTATVYSVSPEAATQTGDGRIYFAVGILAVAVVIVILMIVLRKKSDSDKD